jgi:hypothetical protein
LKSLDSAGIGIVKPLVQLGLLLGIGLFSGRRWINDVSLKAKDVVERDSPKAEIVLSIKEALRIDTVDRIPCYVRISVPTLWIARASASDIRRV